MSRLLFAIILWLVMGLSAYHAQAQEPAAIQPPIAAALAEPVIEIDVNYSGAKISMFAAVQAINEPDISYAVTLVGPQRPHAIVHQHDDRKDRFVFSAAPSVIAVAADPQLTDIVSPHALLQTQIHPAFVARPSAQHADAPNLQTWRRILADLKTDQGLFSYTANGVQRLAGTLIRADIELPADAPPGDYDVRIIQFRKGVIEAQSATSLQLVRKGAENTLWKMAHDLPILYGILAVCVGVALGGVGAAFGAKR